MARLSDRLYDEFLNGTWDLPVTRSGTQADSKQVFKQTKQRTGDTNMGTLRTLNLTLIDNHPDLKASEKVVFQQLNYVTEHTNEQTIQQVLMTGDVENALAKHNAKRAKVVDDAILRNTGRDVFLKPVEIWDLQWKLIEIA